MYASIRRRSQSGAVVFAALALSQLLVFRASPAVAEDTAADPLEWNELERAFWFDGPALLLSPQERRALSRMGEVERSAWIDSFLGRDPIPETPENELQVGIRKRQDMVRARYTSFLDERAKVLFLRGPAAVEEEVHCDQVFKPLEVWSWARPGTVPEKPEDYFRVVFYEPQPDQPWRLWLPLDSKRVLYYGQMEYWLEQYEEFRSRIRGRRFDLQLCKEAKTVDRVTGIDGLHGFKEGRPANADFAPLLRAPRDLADWSRAASAGRSPKRAVLPVESVEVRYPRRDGQRIQSRVIVMLPVDAGLEVFEEELSGKKEHRINVDAILEQDGTLFDEWKVRFQVPVEEEERKPVALVLDRSLRPGAEFLLRLRIRDEIGDASTFLSRGLVVPPEPIQISEEIPNDEDIFVSIGERLAREGVAVEDSLVLVPPETDVVMGLWRADTIVTGSRTERVRFLVDGEVQMVKTKAPWGAELRLSRYPTEQTIRAEALDAAGDLVTSDELVINLQRGELRIELLSPEAGVKVAGQIEARADVIVPEEKKIERLEFLVNGDLQATLEQPPWTAMINVPATAVAADVTYVNAVVHLDDGSQAEDVNILNAPDFVEQVDIDFVELYTTVTPSGGGAPVTGLEGSDFSVFEDGRPQELARFELVEDLPITVGITIDTSGSMLESLGEAKTAAVGFLESIISPKDKSFAVSFATVPSLLMARTSDVSAVEASFDNLVANGNTSLYDAIITSLYYFRGVKGRRALVLLSDGEDTASTIPWSDSLEYARRSGVSIYTIGLNIGRLQVGVRGKLENLAQETGGRAFFINRAVELENVYGQIERELRSQYLLAYASDRPAEADGADTFRIVEVKVRGGLKARTASGYYP